MKFRKWGQSLLVTALSAGVGLGLTSCGGSNTIDYLYLASSKNDPGQINAYRVDSETGALTQIPNSPFPAGRDPVGLVTSPNGKNLYVVNHDDNTIIVYGIGTDAKLYAQATYNTPGTEPVSVGINAAGTLLFVVDFYAPLFTDLNPGPGALVVYPIDAASGNLLTGAATQTISPTQSATYYPLGTAPTSVSVLPNGNTVYVTERLTAAAGGCAMGAGAAVALSVGSSGALTPVAGSPFCAGTTPSFVTSHPSGSYVYVTDSAQNDVLEYTVDGSGALTLSATVATGVAPSSVVVHPNGLFMYVTNRGSTNLMSYSIAAGTGVPTATGSVTTGPLPQCVLVEPRLERFVYTADFNGTGSSGYKLDPTTGLLSATDGSPYGGTGLSTCVAATTHGGQT